MSPSGASEVRRGRSAKPALSQRSIIEATLDLVRERGVEAVSLRQVAERLDTGPASLYAYFPNREVLLAHVLDAAYAQVDLVEVGPGGRGWREALAGTIASTIGTLARYPGLGVVALGTIPVLPGALRLAEHELSLMAAGGVPDDRSALAVDLIAQHAAAAAIERAVRRRRGRGAAERDDVRAVYAGADPALFPRVGRAAALLTGPDDSARQAFAIRVLIEGIVGAALD